VYILWAHHICTCNIKLRCWPWLR